MAAGVEVVIVGGGIWGLSAAYHLSRRAETRVCVLERNLELAAETTPRAAGLMSQFRASPTLVRAIRYGLDLFERFADETGHDPGLRRNGSLYVALTLARWKAFEAMAVAARAAGLETRPVGGEEARRLAPALDPTTVFGSLFVPTDGHLDPRQCALALAAAARDAGVRIETGVAVASLCRHGRRVVGVETSRGFVAGDVTIVTAGPWTVDFARQAGFSAPTLSLRHQRARTVPTAGIPDHHPVVRLAERSCYLRGDGDRYLFGFFEPTPMRIDVDGFRTSDLDPPVATMEEARRRLALHFPVLAELEIAEYFPGATTFSPDGRYLIGPAPGVEGLLWATGCSALGIAGSAAIGKWLADWAMDGQPSPEAREFDPLRFGEQANDWSWVEAACQASYADYYAVRAE